MDMKIAVEQRPGGPVLTRDGAELLPYAYATYNPLCGDFEGFRACGVRILSVTVNLTDSGNSPQNTLKAYGPSFHPAEGAWDFSAVESDLCRALGDDENALVLPRVSLNPPRWWRKAHPEEMARDAAGEAVFASFCSEKWIALCAEALERLTDFLKSCGLYARLAGYHIAAGSSQEFLRPFSYQGQKLDYSDCAKAAYAAWRCERGLPPTAMPSPARREYALCGDLRHLERERDVIEYYQFHSESVAEAALRICRAAKAALAHERLVGVFYGYTATSWDTEVSHHAMRKVLEAPEVDFIAGPLDYGNMRGPDGDWLFPGPVASARLHGKLWFTEADVRTCLTRPIQENMPWVLPEGDKGFTGGLWQGPATEKRSLDDMTKVFAKALCAGSALWWFDMWGGWYQNDALMAFQRRAREVFAQRHAQAGHAQLAVFLDERAFAYMRPLPEAAQRCVYDQMVQVSRVGAPHDLYLLSDLPKVDLSGYRMALVCNALTLTPEEEAALDAFRAAGRTVALTGLPGYARGVRVPFAWEWAEPRPANGLPRVRLLPDAGDYTPDTDSDGAARSVLRACDGGTLFWQPDAPISAERLRQLLSFAGAHLYNHQGALIYAGAGLVAVQAMQAGRVRIFPGEGHALRDVFTGETLPTEDFFCEADMALGECRLFELV